MISSITISPSGRSAVSVSRLSAVALLLLVSFGSFAATRTKTPPRESRDSAEARTAKAFDDARKQGPQALQDFLYRMPKGADLHVHLSGAIYAESWIRAAGEDHLFVNTKTLSFLSPEKAKDVHNEKSSRFEPPCNETLVEAATVPQCQHLDDALIDAFSMRTFVPTTGDSGHDHFFDSFDKFGGTSKSHMGEWLDEVSARAAAQNEQYLELMDTPNYKDASALAAKIGFTIDFAKYRQEMIDGGIRNSIPVIREALDTAEADRRRREHCGEANEQPACTVKIRYIYQVLRGQSPESVFAQILLGFETAAVDPRFVGLNLVQPEDGYISMRDYRMHMQILDALHGFYPNVHISLHAGELAPGMVPPDGLRFHIRLAVEQGEAERIGHGVDVMYEDRPIELLKEMAAKHVMVEVNLTSNDVILNIKGDEHPFAMYRRYGVPVALSTDDEGVSRIDLTHEYVRAAVTYPLDYRDFKKMVRTGIEHSFLPGASLWQRSMPETLNKPVDACAGQLGNENPTGGCADLISQSEKAQQEWELEHRFHTFEASF